MLAPLLMSGVRLLHIDAGHEYHEVFHQSVLFAPYVQRSGVIVFDDYEDREFPGIEAAVLDFCEINQPRRSVPFFSEGNKIYLCEHAFASTYQRHLLQFGEIAAQYRICHVRDFKVLVGFSELPLPLQDIVKSLGSEPLYYSFNENMLAESAQKHCQLKTS